MFPSQILIAILAFLLFGLVAKAVVNWYSKEEDGVMERRRAASDLVVQFQNVGMNKTADFLKDYSVGDLPGMYSKIHDLAVAVKAGGKDIILKEADTIFKNALNAKLNTAEGRAYIGSLLVEATPAPAAAPVPQLAK